MLSRPLNSREKDDDPAKHGRVAAGSLAGGLAGAAGLTVAGRTAAPKIGSLGSSGIKRVADQLAKFPLRGGRVLSGGALAEALKKISR